VQEFEGALAAAEEAQVDGNRLDASKRALDNAKKRQQEARDGLACDFWLVPAKYIRDCTDERMPSYSELRDKRPNWLVKVRRTLEGACLGEYTADLAVSK
jgi:hypothetical protein